MPSTDGIEIAVHDLGGEGPVLLACHATGFHGHVWQPVARRLRDFHVFAPDFRGHGDSSAPHDLDYDWSGFADDVLAVVAELAPSGEQIVAAGHSKGGAALLLAEQRRPGTFAAVWCYEPVVFPPLDGAHSLDNPLAEGALRRRETFASAVAAFENFASKPPFNTLDPEALGAYVRFGFRPEPDGTVRLKCPPVVESKVYRMGSQHGAFEHLSKVTCPVTVVSGAELPFGPSAFAARVVERLPNGRLETHPDLGHFGPLEDPARIADSIRQALRDSALSR
ncbi:MAG: alpha/beta hydrolase [Acidimicrobiales bacterium]|nr:alpha/beta hydrolase [Acidimicrobiales bacterium]